MSMTMDNRTAQKETFVDWLLMLLLGVVGVLIVIRKYGRMTGVHALLIFVHAFVVIISVNLALAFNAVATFPGLEVKNSYVASQSFDADRAAQLALGWTVSADVTDGILHLSITDEAGLPVEVTEVSGTFGRATSVRDDQTPDFVFQNGVYSAPVNIAPGNWNLRFVAIAEDGTQFRQRVVVLVNR